VICSRAALENRVFARDGSSHASPGRPEEGGGAHPRFFFFFCVAGLGIAAGREFADSDGTGFHTVPGPPAGARRHPKPLGIFTSSTSESARRWVDHFVEELGRSLSSRHVSKAVRASFAGRAPTGGPRVARRGSVTSRHIPKSVRRAIRQDHRTSASNQAPSRSDSRQADSRRHGSRFLRACGFAAKTPAARLEMEILRHDREANLDAVSESPWKFRLGFEHVICCDSRSRDHTPQMSGIKRGTE